MKKLIRIFLFSGMLSAMLCTIGCKHNTNIDSKTTEAAYPVEADCYLRRLGISDEGIVFVEDNLYCFFDYETNEKLILCSKINCPHRKLTEDEISNGMEACSAYTTYDDRAEYSIIYRNKRYEVYGDYARSIIYVSEWDGSGKKELCSFEGCVFGQMKISDSKLWFILNREHSVEIEENFNKSVNEFFPAVVNLQNGNITMCEQSWAENEEVFINMNLYFCDDKYMYFSEDTRKVQIYTSAVAMERATTGGTYAEETTSFTFWRMGIDGRAEQFTNFNPGNDGFISCVGPHTMFYHDSEGEWWSMDYASGVVQKITKNDVPEFETENERYYSEINEEGSVIGMRVKNFVDGTEKVAYFPPNEIRRFIVGNHIIFVHYLDDIESCPNPEERRKVYRIYTLADFFKGDFSNRKEVEIPSSVW